jgi:hypothetical protein
LLDAVATGFEFIVIEVCAVAEHPVVEMVTVTLYIPASVVVAFTIAGYWYNVPHS